MSQAFLCILLPLFFSSEKVSMLRNRRHNEPKVTRNGVAVIYSAIQVQIPHMTNVLCCPPENKITTVFHGKGKLCSKRQRNRTEGIFCPGGISEGAWVGLRSRWQMVFREEVTLGFTLDGGKGFSIQVFNWGC